MAGPDIEELGTVPLPTPRRPEPEQPEPERPEPQQPEPRGAVEPAVPARAQVPVKERGRWWRGLTGSLAAGLTVLAVFVLVIAVVCQFTGAPGPGALMLIGHPVVAVLALFAQHTADRFNGRRGGLAGLAVVVLAAAALALFWWS
ncbi:hypothetical protein [Amycolatopsis sp. H20-H5]|uniref:hypothetical protein n=1 Tax=Amycolatopsis sp. H20-H5 TaxID=3046309 RepID=UPI002DBA4FE6|nr:hypothetical protein [Amycolatopsis sp. H20-H5]MEC3979258.1 hypothetical protein [Amycolatopsis sp. H20-H5]